MGRMHAPGKGLSQSALPYRRSVPTWLKLTSDDVKEQIYKLAKKGLTPSQIGVDFEFECHKPTFLICSLLHSFT
uniref:Small ribosomal subunit protein uS15 N-terminal domain-containing protein n=1 Tax=Cebus imitator TaxID=2715852 RepID=A0A2K5PF19_CEBIM